MESSIKDHPKVDGTISDTLYLTGIKKTVDLGLLQSALKELSADIVDGVLSGGKAWIRCSCSRNALSTIQRFTNEQRSYYRADKKDKGTAHFELHQLFNRQAKPIHMRFELGLDALGNRRKDHRLESRPIRQIQRIPNNAGGKANHSIHPLQSVSSPCPLSITYHNTSIGVQDGIEERRYPFPTGTYLLEFARKVYELQKQYGVDLGANFYGTSWKNATKEIGESMAMVSAIHRAIDWVILHDHVAPLLDRVYVLGDGTHGLVGMFLQMYLTTEENASLQIVSIDPLIDSTKYNLLDTVNGFTKHQRLKALSQDVIITPRSEYERGYTIIVSCHSHAPLQEFWNRVNGPKMSISMPCCSDYGVLSMKQDQSELMLAYDDYEVASPKRHVCIIREK